MPRARKGAPLVCRPAIAARGCPRRCHLCSSAQLCVLAACRVTLRSSLGTDMMSRPRPLQRRWLQSCRLCVTAQGPGPLPVGSKRCGPERYLKPADDAGLRLRCSEKTSVVPPHAAAARTVPSRVHQSCGRSAAVSMVVLLAMFFFCVCHPGAPEEWVHMRHSMMRRGGRGTKMRLPSLPVSGGVFDVREGEFRVGPCSPRGLRQRWHGVLMAYVPSALGHGL